MNAPKPFVVFLIVVAILLVGLYVLGVGMGQRDRPEPDPKALAASFSGGQAVRLSELAPAGSSSASSGCAQAPPNVLRVKGSCAYRVAPAHWWQRRSLVLQPDRKVRVVVVPAGGPSVKVDGEVEPKPNPKDAARFAIPGDGAKVEITCLTAGADCTVQVLGV